MLALSSPGPCACGPRATPPWTPYPSSNSISENAMQIEMWDIDRPKDYKNNARKWSAQAVAKVGSSIKTYGWRQPVVVDREEVIVIGHVRRAAGKSVGETSDSPANCRISLRRTSIFRWRDPIRKSLRSFSPSPTTMSKPTSLRRYQRIQCAG